MNSVFDILYSPAHMLAVRSSSDKRKLSTESGVNLVINGEDYHDLPEGLSVAALIAHLELPGKKIAIERNREVIPKSTFDTVVLADGDRLEIIHFIGGG